MTITPGSRVRTGTCAEQVCGGRFAAVPEGKVTLLTDKPVLTGTEAVAATGKGGERMPLNPSQRRILEDWMRSKAIIQCPACGGDRWRFAEAAYLRALLEAGDANLTEDRGVVKLSCDNCGYVMLFDAERVGIRGLWDKGRDV